MCDGKRGREPIPPFSCSLSFLVSFPEPGACGRNHPCSASSLLSPPQAELPSLVYFAPGALLPPFAGSFVNFSPPGGLVSR